jgi:RNA polymerase sigma factor (sigma-70 family)
MITELIQAYQPLVRQLASRYATPQTPIEDLIPEGNRALIEAYKRFDPSKGQTPGQFAKERIREAIRKCVRKSLRVETGLDAANRPDPRSDPNRTFGAGSGENKVWGITEKDVHDALATLTDDEHRCAVAHWIEQRTQAEIAAAMKLSPHRVRILLETATAKLRNHLSEPDQKPTQPGEMGACGKPLGCGSKSNRVPMESTSPLQDNFIRAMEESWQPLHSIPCRPTAQRFSGAA